MRLRPLSAALLKSHFASAADAPSPSDYVCHLSRFIGRAYPKGESKRLFLYNCRRQYHFATQNFTCHQANIAAATRLYPLMPPIVTFPIIFSLNTINTTRIGTHAIKHAASFLGVVRLCLTPSITRSIWSVDDCILNKP